jgi:hypothetical protein
VRTSVPTSMGNSKDWWRRYCGLFQCTVPTFDRKDWRKPKEKCEKNRCPGRNSNGGLPNTRQRRGCLSQLPASQVSGTKPCLFWDPHVAIGPEHILWANCSRRTSTRLHGLTPLLWEPEIQHTSQFTIHSRHITLVYNNLHIWQIVL